MNEKLNLVEILKGCLNGAIFYSPLFGNVILQRVLQNGNDYAIEMKTARTQTNVSFTTDGRFYDSEIDGECMLFPSKDCRDWSQFKQPQMEFKNGDHILFRNSDGKEFFGLFEKYVDGGRCSITIFGSGMTITNWELYPKDLIKLEKFDPKLLKTGDAVLVRDRIGQCEWMYSIFSHISFEEGKPYYIASCVSWELCVPYNKETKDLIGTCDKAPQFYDLTEKQD